MALHAFHDDDYGIHHDTNHKHQTKQRKGVNRKTEQREEDEGAYQRNWYGQKRNQRRAPALKKKKNNDDDQDQRDDQGFDDFLDSLSHGKRRVEGNGEIHVVGK